MELGSGVVLTEKIERKIRKVTPQSPPPMEKISLKSHKFEKIPQEEKVRHFVEQFTNLKYMRTNPRTKIYYVLIFSPSLTQLSY